MGSVACRCSVVAAGPHLCTGQKAPLLCRLTSYHQVTQMQVDKLPPDTTQMQVTSYHTDAG